MTVNGAGPDGRPYPQELIEAELARFRTGLELDRRTNIGFPGAVDFDYGPILPYFHYLLNNVGDPYVDGSGRLHTKRFEREVVDFVADLMRAPRDDRWGYVTSGGTDGNQYGLSLARSLYPDALVYFSQAAHYSVAKVVERLRMPAVMVKANPDGEMNYRDLRAVVRSHRDRPAIVVASVGTTLTEAVDDVGRVRAALDDAAIRDSYVHADAALAGIPLALLDDPAKPAFDLADGADSLSVSGHKFIGCPVPCGVLVTRKSLRERVSRPVDYIGGVDSTIGGSRSGHAPLMLWYAIRSRGVAGLRHRADASRDLADYAVRRLTSAGWPAWRHRYAFTVVFAEPPAPVADRWMLACRGGLSHLICMPGVAGDQIDDFVADLVASLDDIQRVNVSASV